MKFLIAFVLLLAPLSMALAAPSVDPKLEAALAAAPLKPEAAIITYERRPGATELARLSAAGVSGGVVLNELPMVLTLVNKAQLSAIRAQPGVLSVYGNRIYQPYTNASRGFIGQEALMRDREVTFANGGLPVSGKGVGVALIDTGIDATHRDLELGSKVVQNVLFPLAEVPADPPAGFGAPIALENQPISDAEGGHGTFVSGVIGATGASSGNFYGGVAPGASLIGLVAGNDVGLSTFAIVQAYDYVLVNQFRYNIRVANNSFGSDLGDPSNYDPLDPINVGTRALHDRFIAVIYAAGNSGDVPGAINALSVAPWVISVAAGEKEGLGSPASFSSRGENDGGNPDTAGQPADPAAPANLRPDITGPGNNIKSTRSKGPGVTNFAGTALLQDLDVAPAFLPFYTTSQGTSFSAPHLSGVAALMFEANPQMTPDDVARILRDTATPMPFPERVVGAGYVDAHNAVRAALNFTPVPHPANLIPGPDAPEISDIRGDQLGTEAHDILTGRFEFDPATAQLVYTLQVADLEDLAPGARWTMQSNFGATAIFVSASVNELGENEFEYGRIAILETGTRNQETLGAADAGELDVAEDRVRVFLGVGKISSAVGFDVIGTTSTATQARTQILIGTSFTGGLLLNADSAAGQDFTMGGASPPPPEEEDPPTAAICAESGVKERFAGAIAAGGGHEGQAFVNECARVDVRLSYHPGGADLVIVLEDANGAELARGTTGDGKRIRRMDLPKGQYRVRIDGAPAKSVDYVIDVRGWD